jgi:hypothetical protein
MQRAHGAQELPPLPKERELRERSATIRSIATSPVPHEAAAKDD